MLFPWIIPSPAQNLSPALTPLAGRSPLTEEAWPNCRESHFRTHVRMTGRSPLKRRPYSRVASSGRYRPERPDPGRDLALPRAEAWSGSWSSPDCLGCWVFRWVGVLGFRWSGSESWWPACWVSGGVMVSGEVGSTEMKGYFCLCTKIYYNLF